MSTFCKKYGERWRAEIVKLARGFCVPDYKINEILKQTEQTRTGKENDDTLYDRAWAKLINIV